MLNPWFEDFLFCIGFIPELAIPKQLQRQFSFTSEAVPWKSLSSYPDSLTSPRNIEKSNRPSLSPIQNQLCVIMTNEYINQ